MTVWALQVHVSYGQYILQGPDAEPVPPPYVGGNGLIWVAGGAAVVATGLDYGDLALTLDVRDGPPETDPPELHSWDDIVEISIAIPSNHISVYGPTDIDGHSVPLPAVAGLPRSYRLRVHTRGRDQGHQVRSVRTDQGESIVEEHLIILWAAPHSPETRLKLTDRVGAQIRADTSGSGISAGDDPVG